MVYLFSHLFIVNISVFHCFRYVSFKQQIVVFYFLIQCVNLCLLTGAFSFLTFNENSDKFSFKSTILFCAYYLSCLLVSFNSPFVSSFTNYSFSPSITLEIKHSVSILEILICTINQHLYPPPG